MTIFAISVAKATLLAAIIAAAAAVLKLVVDGLAGRGAEVRAAHREILQPHLEELGTAIHEVVSGAVLIHRRAKAGQVPGASADQASRGVDTLKRKRLEVKYILDGLEEPLRILTRGHDWTATYKGHESGDEFLERLRGLSRGIDKCIARSYRRGRPPSATERWKLNRQAKKLRAIWERRFAGSEATKPGDALDAGSTPPSP